MELVLSAEAVVTAVLLVLSGVAIGVFSGLLGIGGGTVMVPLLRLAFGFSAYAATATSMFAIIPTSISGAVAHLRARTCLLKLGLALGCGGAVTSALGVYLASLSPSWSIMLVAALIILYSAYNMLRKALRLPARGACGNGFVAKGASGTDVARASAAGAGAVAGASGGVPTVPGPAAQRSGESQQAQADSESAAQSWLNGRMTGRQLCLSVGIGLVAGLASGYVGVGGGFIMVPLMSSWLNLPMRYASGTSLLAIIILCVPGVIEQMLLGNVDYLAGVLLVAGSIPGAALGARLSQKVPERTLRFLFAGFLGLAAIMLLVKEALVAF